MDELKAAGQLPGRKPASIPIEPPVLRDFAFERVKAETDPIRVYRRKRDWLVDYGSYAHGYYPTRSQAVTAGEAGARREGRELSISAADNTRINGSLPADAAPLARRRDHRRLGRDG
jgi:hypothetical protein